MKRKNPAAVALGRRGGKARAGKLTPAERSEIARKAGLAGGRGRGKQPAPIVVTKDDSIEDIRRQLQKWMKH